MSLRNRPAVNASEWNTLTTYAAVASEVRLVNKALDVPNQAAGATDHWFRSLHASSLISSKMLSRNMPIFFFAFADFVRGRLFGDDNKKSNGKNKSKMRGSLRCATDDETVCCFGRDDACLGWVEIGKTKPPCLGANTPRRSRRLAFR
jgi:hypothetical protein